MILSYHPCFEADKNLICAGRAPGFGDLAAIKNARAVILPQGCRAPLYQMARRNCFHVFPNYDARFIYQGKIGQIELFKKQKAFHPNTLTFRCICDYYVRFGKYGEAPFPFPFVFKFDWGGGGDTVFFIDSSRTFHEVLKKAEACERSGAKGFLLQEYILSENRSIRVVVVGRRICSYWRIQRDPNSLYASVSKGAVIDSETDPHLQENACRIVEAFCNKTSINLAGFDLLFSSKSPTAPPFFLEINYFFGREGLGGSFVFYQVLESEINNWLSHLGLGKRTFHGTVCDRS